ncbi:hypothetical protein QE152_g26689 [Popillia japonica]|uniref:Uncharacterized protein n=1 Tax=Popillia japonica TaxID=7064 RepID=A0AAW1JXP6_POPJA
MRLHTEYHSRSKPGKHAALQTTIEQRTQHNSTRQTDALIGYGERYKRNNPANGSTPTEIWTRPNYESSKTPARSICA